MLRISASLDLETVLQEVADGACELTGARYGCIVTVDESGTPGDFVTSGLTEEDHHRVAAWPDGLPTVYPAGWPPGLPGRVSSRCAS